MVAFKQSLFLALFAILIAASLTPAAVRAHEDPVEHEIHELLDAFLAGASVNDIEMHDRFWAEDLVYTSSAGERRGKAEIMASLRAAPEAEPGSLPRYRGEDVTIRVFDEIAVVTFRLIAEVAGGAVDQYFNTGVFRRDDGRWKAIAWQATRIPEDDRDG